MTDDWPAQGTVLAGRYRLLALLGVGGMSTVWRARDDILGRDVAVKVLAGPYAVDVRCRAVIGREARAVARLSHPHIVAVHDYGEAKRPDGAVLPYIVMELLDGEPLQAHLNRGPLSWREAAAVCADVAAALAEAHRHGVVHRDVTPGNILMTPAGAKVVDFGIAAPVGEQDEDATGLMFGTLEYVAPERLDGSPADAATDVFALGVLLYELVTGRAPFPAESWDDIADAHDAGPPPPPSELPSALAEMCVRCLSVDPDDRPTADEVAAALLSAACTARAPAPPQTAELPRPRPGRTLAVIAVAMALAGVAVAVTALPFTVPEPRSPLTAPLPRDTPPATPPARVTPPPIASSVPSPSAVPTEPVDLFERFDALVSAGLSRGEIRPDVATDLRNVLSNLAAAGDAAAGSADLRRKIDDRVREGALSRGLARQLREALALPQDAS